MQTSCIILAAGQSRRFGAPKMLHQLADGRSILQTTIEFYLTLFETVSVVGHPKDDARIESYGADYIASPNAQQGMSQSLMAGVAATSSSHSWLIALADMPYVKQSTIQLMLEQAAVDRILIPEYEGRRGNPVLFGRAFREDLLSLQGDSGARNVSNRYAEAVTLVQVEDYGIHHDIDTPEEILDTVTPIVI